MGRRGKHFNFNYRYSKKTEGGILTGLYRFFKL